MAPRARAAERKAAKTKVAKSANANGKRAIATYEHRDANGNPIARMLRYEPKSFSWQRWEGGVWVDGLGSVKVPLYRLPEIACEPFVVLTEGQKDSDAGATIGLATTTSGGTGSFRPDHADALRGKEVCIIADAEAPGRGHAQKVAAMLYGRAKGVKIIELADAKDLAEAIERGLTLNTFLELRDQAPEWRSAAGNEILDSVRQFIRRFVALSDNQAIVGSLFPAHTHALEAADCTPYLQVNSAEKGSGKTRLLEVLRHLVFGAWLTGRVSAAVLTRKVDAVRPTLLLDESDAAFGSEKEYAEALRGILNTGYRRGGVASCCVGRGAGISYRDFSTFCPKAIAGIGKLPDTVADRSIPIRLKRARRGEVQRFRERDIERDAGEIKARTRRMVRDES